MIIITGANDRYMDILQQFITSNHEVVSLCKLLIYNLGLSAKNLDLLGKYTVINFDYSKYPEHVNLNNYNGDYCTYAWKPIIIHEVAKQYPDDYVIWADTRTFIPASTINRISKNIDNDGAWLPISNHRDVSNLKWIYNLEYFGLSSSSILEFDIKLGGLCGFKYSNPVSKNILDQWQSYALIKDAIAPEGSSRSNHRQDQAVLSVVIYKLGYSDRFNDDRCGVRPWSLGHDKH